MGLLVLFIMPFLLTAVVPQFSSSDTDDTHVSSVLVLLSLTVTVFKSRTSFYSPFTVVFSRPREALMDPHRIF